MITAILLASFMGISTMPATAWAADSYKETEKAAVAKAIQEFGADYAESLSQMNTEEVKGNAEMKISLDDGGKSNSWNAFSCGYLLAVGCIYQCRCWSYRQGYDRSYGSERERNKDLYHRILHGYGEFRNYMKIPELSDGYIKMNMDQMTQEAVEEADQEMDSSFSASMDMADAMNSYFSTFGESAGSRCAYFHSDQVYRHYFLTMLQMLRIREHRKRLLVM